MWICAGASPGTACAGISGSAVAEDVTGSPWKRLKGCCCLRGGLAKGPSAMAAKMQNCAGWCAACVRQILDLC